jgi:hypothetical protein
MLMPLEVKHRFFLKYFFFDFPKINIIKQIYQIYTSATVSYGVKIQTPCGKAVRPSANGRGAGLPCKWAWDPSAT